MIPFNGAKQLTPLRLTFSPHVNVVNLNLPLIYPNLRKLSKSVITDLSRDFVVPMCVKTLWQPRVDAGRKYQRVQVGSDGFSHNELCRRLAAKGLLRYLPKMSAYLLFEFSQKGYGNCNWNRWLLLPGDHRTKQQTAPFLTTLKNLS